VAQPVGKPAFDGFWKAMELFLRFDLAADELSHHKHHQRHQRLVGRGETPCWLILSGLRFCIPMRTEPHVTMSAELSQPSSQKDSVGGVMVCQRSLLVTQTPCPPEHVVEVATLQYDDLRYRKSEK
jgi:hypothetical protein